jgi:uncharacterized protein YciU (UPF0263 family)
VERLRTLAVDSALGTAEVALSWGNLMNVGRSEPVDILVVSTFPNDYWPTPSSLVGELSFRGVNMSTLAANKEKEWAVFGSWLSTDLHPLRSGVNARRILCIEGADPHRLFRSLVAAVAERHEPVTVAMPVIGSGDQGYPFEVVLPNILEAAVEWIRLGMPVRRLEIVIRNRKEATEAAAIVDDFAPRSRPSTDRSTEKAFDLFLSYAHKDAHLADVLLYAFQSLDARVFIDRKDIAPGVIWQDEIYLAVDNSQAVVALLNESYQHCAMCIEEFQLALIRRRKERRDVLLPIYLHTADLPTYMQLVQWIDCREGDEQKLKAAAATVMRRIRNRRP